MNVGSGFVKVGKTLTPLHLTGSSLFLGSTGAVTPRSPFLTEPTTVDGTLTYNTASGQVQYKQVSTRATFTTSGSVTTTNYFLNGNNYRCFRFTSSGTLTITSLGPFANSNPTFDAIIVGGGGGGGYSEGINNVGAGGGGAGGVF